MLKSITLTVDPWGNVVLAGPFEGEIEIAGRRLLSQAPTDIFVAKFEHGTGRLLWSTSLDRATRSAEEGVAALHDSAPGEDQQAAEPSQPAPREHEHEHEHEHELGGAAAPATLQHEVAARDSFPPMTFELAGAGGDRLLRRRTTLRRGVGATVGLAGALMVAVWSGQHLEPLAAADAVALAAQHAEPAPLAWPAEAPAAEAEARLAEALVAEELLAGELRVEEAPAADVSPTAPEVVDDGTVDGEDLADGPFLAGEPTAAPAPAPQGPPPAELRAGTLTLLAQGKIEAAAEMAEALIAAAPDDALGYLYRGAALQELGRADDARAAYRACGKLARSGAVWECVALGGR